MANDEPLTAEEEALHLINGFGLALIEHPGPDQRTKDYLADMLRVFGAALDAARAEERAAEAGGLDAAWKAAETALPEGWAICLLWGTVTEDRWAVDAGKFPSEPGDPHVYAGGPTPAAALRALAARLATASAEPPAPRAPNEKSEPWQE